MMTFILLAGLVALAILWRAGRNNPNLQLAALGLGILLGVLGSVHAYRTWFANDLVMRKYQDQVAGRQVLLGERMAGDLGRSKEWKEAIFFEDVTNIFSDDLLKGLKKEWPSDRPLHVYQGDSPSYLEGPADFSFRSTDLKAALTQYRNADLLVFSGRVPSGTQGRKIVLLNVPTRKMESVTKNALVLAAACDRPPTVRPSVQKRRVGKPDEEFEFFFREP